MNLDLIISIGLILIFLISLYLKTNIALSIFGLGMGYVLADLTTNSITSFMYQVGLGAGDFPLSSVIAIILTIIPSLLVLVRFRGFQAGRLFEHIIPSIFFTLFFVLLILYLLPFDVKQNLSDKSYAFSQFEYFKTAIVVGAAGIAIFDVMLHEQKLARKGRKGKHKG